MIFDLARSISVLERTPTVLRAWLTSLDSAWTHTKDREDTWSPFDVLGHLIHGERTDWIPRAKIILSDSPPADRIFEPFDRFAQFRDSEGKTLGRLLDEFEQLRVANLRVLKGLGITESDLDRTGRSSSSWPSDAEPASRDVDGTRPQPYRADRRGDGQAVSRRARSLARLSRDHARRSGGGRLSSRFPPDHPRRRAIRWSKARQIRRMPSNTAPLPH